jgi:zinc protease
LDELTKASEPPFIYVTAYFNDMVLTKDGFRLFAVVNDDDIIKGVQTLLIEGQRLNRHGFTKTELEREKKQVLREIQKAFDEREKTESRSFVREYVSNFLSGEPIPGIASELEMHKTFLPNISMEEINEFSHLYMKDFNRVVSVRAPKKEGINIPTESEILNIFDEVKNIPISPYVDAVSDEPLIAVLPDPGKMLSEKIYSSVGITEWIMDNGVRVLLKSTDFKNDEILFKAYSPGGTSLAGDKDFLSAYLATDIISESGIGNFSSIQL